MTFVVVYSSRIENGLPCPDAQSRCEVAIRKALAEDGVIVLGAGGVRARGRQYSQVMRGYLVNRGWPEDRILVNAAGFGSVAESQAAYDAIKAAGGGPVIAVSAWYHVLRVWLIWALVLRKRVRLGVSWKTYPWTNALRELVLFPLHAWEIIRSIK